jgi:hypothetical protein
MNWIKIDLAKKEQTLRVELLLYLFLAGFLLWLYIFTPIGVRFMAIKVALLLRGRTKHYL